MRTAPSMVLSSLPTWAQSSHQHHCSLVSSVQRLSAAEDDANTQTFGGHGKPPAGYVYEVPVNRPLQRLPGASMLMPKRNVASNRITLAPVTYRVSDRDYLALRVACPCVLVHVCHVSHVHVCLCAVSTGVRHDHCLPLHGHGHNSASTTAQQG
jgi:hypothetical protein